MTYFGVLLRFIVPLLIILAIFVPRDLYAWLRDRSKPVDRRAYIVLALHVFLSLAYTTPWDNYLVATGVWWYDENLVTGIRLGYVPIEEYTFFVVQTLTVGLAALALRRMPVFREPAVPANMPVRVAATLLLGLGWLVSTAVLLSGYVPATYMTLILSWALPPIMLQFIFGADILWANRRLVATIIVPPTLYLWVVDYLAIQSGTWTLSPTQTLGLNLGVLPIEEMTFFLVTNVLIGFGIVLMMSPAAQRRADALVAALRARFRRNAEQAVQDA